MPLDNKLLRQNVPARLKNSSRWVLWRLEDYEDRQRCKILKQVKAPTRNAKSNDPDTWASFEEALAAPLPQVPAAYQDDPYPAGVGLVFGAPFVGVDLDKCYDPVSGKIDDWADEFLKAVPPTYIEVTPSRTGFHLWYSCADHAKLPDGVRAEKAEFYTRGRYFTMTGQKPSTSKDDLAEITLQQGMDIFHLVEALKKKPGAQSAPSVSPKFEKLMTSVDFPDLSAAVHALLIQLCYRYDSDVEFVEKKFKDSKLFQDTHWKEKWERLRASELKLAIAVVAANPRGQKSREIIDPDTWRDGCMSLGQLPQDPPRFLIHQLIPDKALTLIPAPSYNCKTWFAVAGGHAISIGADLWGFKGPSEPVPVLYHVPEMNAALIRHYMSVVGVTDSENFLVRPMELGLWPLDDPRMLRSAAGRVVFLDTAGYFNPADDASNYQQAIRFATLVHNLMVTGGARAVVGLYHPPKNAKEEAVWTLENSVLGSAGYGGILRSCLRLANLNTDLNDPDVWVYVQGLKNPGLKPFQLEGPVPLKMKLSPSPYLKDLLREMATEDPQEKLVRAWVREEVGVNEIGRRLQAKFTGKGKNKAWSHGKVSAEVSRLKEEQEQPELVTTDY